MLRGVSQSDRPGLTERKRGYSNARELNWSDGDRQTSLIPACTLKFKRQKVNGIQIYI